MMHGNINVKCGLCIAVCSSVKTKSDFCYRVYCEYNSMSDHRFKTPEEQVLWFLSKAGKPGWKWMSLRPRSPLKDGPHNMKKTEKDSYFCKSLNFDRNKSWSLYISENIVFS